MSQPASSLLDPARPACLAINHLLKQESWARDKLLKHTGKRAQLMLSMFELRLQVDQQGLVAPTDSAPADVSIQLQGDSLLQTLMQLREGTGSPRMKIEGDIAFAQTISELAQQLRWEPEEDLSKVVGDVAAVRLMQLLRSGASTAKDVQERFASSTAEYLLEEQPMLVRPRHVQEFTAQVQALRDAVERTTKRVERLEQQAPLHNGTAQS